MLKTIAISAATLLAAAAAASGAQAGVGTVFYIAMENHNWTQPASYTGTNQIYGNSAAPFINSLVTPGNPNAALVSYASNYVNVSPSTHPSEPNYVWMEAGTDANNSGVLNDNNPYQMISSTNSNNQISTAANLSGVLQSKGISWKSYQEGTDLLTTGGVNVDGVAPINSLGGSTGTVNNLTNTVATGQYEVPLYSFSGTSASYTNPYNGSHQYNFAAKHDGSLFFADTNGGNDRTTANTEAKYYAPLEQLSTDLANNTVAKYNWITPDQYNDMHSQLTGGFTYNGIHYTGDQAMIAQGDNFLSQIIPLIEASDAFKNNGEIVIWNDETEGDQGLGTTDGFTSMEIVISPLAKGNAYTNTIQYTHSNDLKTIQEITGVDGTPLGGAAGAYDMRDLYKAGAIPEPATWAMMLTGLGLVGGAMRRRAKVVAA